MAKSSKGGKGKKGTSKKINLETTRKDGKPRLKLNTSGVKKTGSLGGVTKRKGTPLPKTCLGYVENVVTGLCRCDVCRTLPHDQRTKRPFDSAQSAPPTTPTTSPTSSSVPSSTPRKGLRGKTPTLTTAEPTTKKFDTDHDPQDLADMAAQTKWVGVDPAKPGAERTVKGVLGNQLLTVGNSGAPHIVIIAYAGTGKTTTGIEGLKTMLGFGTHITPSDEQKAIWNALMQSKGAKDIGYTSFSNTIVDELKKRVPPGVEALTMHGLGFRAINRAFHLWGGSRSVNNGRDRDSGYRTKQIVSELMRTPVDDLFRTKGQFMSAVVELVAYCKVNLVGYGSPVGDGNVMRRFDPGWVDTDTLDDLVDHFDVDLDGTSRDEVYPIIPRVLQRALDVNRDRYIDFNDMIWLPVVANLAVKQYDLLMVDEAQDLNRAQQMLAQKATEYGRLLFCGDPNQAIYGFAGADCESMSRMIETMRDTERGVVVLSLTETRRCGKAIVKEANKIVPDFKAHESNPEGKISRYSLDVKSVTKYYGMWVKDGDMVVCRVNAPLVSECFRFIKAGKKANIRGRKIGEGLVKLVKRLAPNGTVTELIAALAVWLESEEKKENAKKNPSEDRIITLHDKQDCILCFTEGLNADDSASLVVEKIEKVFTDDRNAPGILLSSIHRVKGLEARRVFLLEPKGCGVPHPMASSPWQIKQEWNLRYVAQTRAIEELVYVS